VQEVVEHLPDETQFRSFANARHSVFRDAPDAMGELLAFLDVLRRAAAGR